MRRIAALVIALVGIVSFAAPGCGSDTGLAGAPDAGGGGITVNGCGSCDANVFAVCNSGGVVTERRDCGTQVCVANRGCLDCAPGGNGCDGNTVKSCGPDGKFSAVVATCDVAAGQRCSGGVCKSACEIEAGSPSNVGCEFWPVHLPNAWGVDGNADYAPWGVVLANAGASDAVVTIEYNEAAYGQPPVPRTLSTFRLRPNELKRELLPVRPIDGGVNEQHDPPPTGTALSGNAYRITSTSPLVVYQFNAAEQQFSNDASLLLPTPVLGTVHRVVSHSAANPVQVPLPGAPPIAGIPDHGYVSIVGTKPNTHVKVVLGAPIQAGSGIPKSPKGATVEAVLGPFEVLNLSTNIENVQELIAGASADMTGTTVESDFPVAVYTGTQRTALAPPESAGFGKFENTCCTDHLEDPVLPMTSLGKTFAIAHSPYRNGNAAREPDLVRFLGAAASTVVTTNLPPPNDQFLLAPGQLRDVWSAQDFAVVASEPLYVSQILVSQTVCGRTIGDPALTSVVAVDQFRSDYLFLMPPSWSENYVVLTVPEGTESEVRVDGLALPATCDSAPIGSIAGTKYLAFRCPFPQGPHKAVGSAPFGLTAYGYGPAGSYAMAAGANVKSIYVPPPLR
jgi:hypothetical protein